MKQICVNAHGGPEQLKCRDGLPPALSPNHALVRVFAAGVTFMDTGVPRGMYWPTKDHHLHFGVEGAGRVSSIAEGGDGLRVGERVAWFYVLGSYAEEIKAPLEALVPIPDDIDDATAAAKIMQGLTASHFATETYDIKLGETALVHSAAGGLSLILTQIIKILGGNVIGRVSTKQKAEVARKAGQISHCRKRRKLCQRGYENHCR